MVTLFCPQCGSKDSVKPRHAPFRQDFEAETVIADFLISDVRTPSGKNVHSNQLSLELHECDKCGLTFAIGEEISRDSKISTVVKFINEGHSKN